MTVLILINAKSKIKFSNIFYYRSSLIASFGSAVGSTPLDVVRVSYLLNLLIFTLCSLVSLVKSVCWSEKLQSLFFCNSSK